MEWLFLLFLGFLGWILGFLVLKSPLLALLPAALTPIIVKLPANVTSLISANISSPLGWITLVVAGMISTVMLFQKPSVAKTVLSTLSIPVFTIYGVGFIGIAYLRMIP
jgi:hypothetical protein